MLGRASVSNLPAQVWRKNRLIAAKFKCCKRFERFAVAVARVLAHLLLFDHIALAGKGK